MKPPHHIITLITCTIHINYTIEHNANNKFNQAQYRHNFKYSFEQRRYKLETR